MSALKGLEIMSLYHMFCFSRSVRYCLDSVNHVMREHSNNGGQGIWMLTFYLFKFIIAFLGMRRQTMIDKVSMNVVQSIKQTVV